MLKSVLYKITRWRMRQNSQRNFLIYCSVFVGMFAGLAAITLKFLVHTMEELSHNISSNLPFHIIYVFLPALGILLTVAYQHFVNRDTIQKGIGSVLFNIKKNRSNLRYNNIYSQLITSSLTVGFGGSSGLEAPIVSTGASIGSNTGKFFNLTAYEKTVLIAAGASAGIAAVFNSPIAGVLFSLEVLIGEITIPTLIPLLIASATGVVVSKALYSGQLFHLVTGGWAMQAIPFYVVLGLFCGWISIYIAKVAPILEKGIIKTENRYLRAIAGGVLLGVMIILFPPLFGEGYHYLQAVLDGHLYVLKEENLFASWLSNPVFMIGFIAALVFTKIIAAGITIGAGGNGGTFAPTMFTGAFLGLFVAFTVNQLGWVHLNTSNFIAVGMAGALSGVLHAPLTSIFLIAEITGGYVLFIPLMIVSAISYIISRLTNPHNVYWHELIHEKDIHPGQDYVMLNAITIDSIISLQHVIVKSDMPLAEFYKVVAGSTVNRFAVVDAGDKLSGIVLVEEIRKQLFEQPEPGAKVVDIASVPPIIIDYQTTAARVLELFDEVDVWHLPVVTDGRFVGFVSKSILLSRYRELFLEQHKQSDLFAKA
ncbi:chloride channel protein [Mucilaginibacter antarcticus]|uniref:Chloride channel protein n=2 Tax=Mucilaginibacter antarcticus TaxID=1855725 RepID=A0ABW5XV79_9SPHI